MGLWFKAYTRMGARRFRVFVRPGTSLRQAAGSVLPMYITAHGFYVRLANFLSPLNQHLGRLEPRSLLGPPHEGWIVGVGADADYEDDMLLEDWQAESDRALALRGGSSHERVGLGFGLPGPSLANFLPRSWPRPRGSWPGGQ